MELETILYEVSSDNVATITINRPDKMNTFTKQMVDEFQHIWQVISADDNVNAVVLRAAECRAFSAGVYLTSNTTDHELFSPYLSGEDPGVGLCPKTNHCWKPVITAVHGICAGGAFYWLNESDIIICSEDAEFFDPHVTYGLTAALEPIGALARLPLGEVLRMALLGNDERITAQTALKISLVSEVVPPRRPVGACARTGGARRTKACRRSAGGPFGRSGSRWMSAAPLRFEWRTKYCQITMMNGTSGTVDVNAVMSPGEEFRPPIAAIARAT